MSEIILSTFYKFLVASIPSCVVKFGKRARDNETLESRKKGDLFVSASLQTDSLLSYGSAPNYVLQEAGLTEEEIKLYSKNLYNVPESKRRTVLYHVRKWYIDNYEEKNNYYRMLNGLPDINSEYEVWLNDMSIYDDYGIEPCPVHEIPHIYLVAMEARGLIEPLIEQYPDQEFLKYLGARRIDIVSARRADNYEMLYFPNVTDSYSFYRDFLMLYEECRQYFLTVIYNKFYSTKYDEYDGYIGFTILTFAINRMIVNNFKAFVQRDFYDEFSTQTFLNAYGVPYSTRFTLPQMTLLAKQLNMLLRVKETDVALLDIIDLLGYSDFSLTKYYLVKKHRLDNKGNPIFAYTTDEETGEQVPDFDKMYELYFSRVNVDNDNIQEAIRDITNKISYNDVTSLDPYWVEDISTINKLKNTQFNYIETKYMDVTVIYRMYRIFFEITYFTRIVLDKSEDTKDIEVSLVRLSDTEIPIFDIMIFLICVMCKLYKVEPNILNSPSKSLHIMGFNYDADIKAIKEDIRKHPDIYNQEILKYIDEVIFTTPEDINNFYLKIKHLDIKLTQLINSATTLKAYRAYRKLYDTLMYIDFSKEVYALPDGRIPTKFTEYLEFANPDLYTAYMELNDDTSISDMISYTTARLMNIFTDLQYLNHMQVVDTTFVEALVKLLEYFKSLTVDLRGVNSILLFDSRLFNGAHFYSDMKMRDASINIEDWALDSIFWEYAKEMHGQMELISERATNDDLARAIVDCYIGMTKLHGDPIIDSLNGKINVVDRIGEPLNVTPLEFDSQIELMSKNITDDELDNLLVQWYLETRLHNNPIINSITEQVVIADKSIEYMNVLHKYIVNMDTFISKIVIEDKSRLLSTIYNIDILHEFDKITNMSSTNKIDEFIFSSFHKLLVYAISVYKDKLNSKGVLEMINTFIKALKLAVIPKLELIATQNVKDRVDMFDDTDSFISYLYHKDYPNLIEFFVSKLSSMIIDDKDFINTCKDSVNHLVLTLPLKLYSERIKTKDTCRFIWEE